MKNEQQLTKALNIIRNSRIGKFFVNIEGYLPFEFDHLYLDRNQKTGKFEVPVLAVDEKLYTWGGQDVCQTLYSVSGRDFADDLTDEQMRTRFIELMENCHPAAITHVVKEEMKVKDLVAKYPDLCVVEQGYPESFACCDLPKEIDSGFVDRRTQDFINEKKKAEYMAKLMDLPVKGYKAVKRPVTRVDLSFVPQRRFVEKDYKGILYIYLKGVER